MLRITMSSATAGADGLAEYYDKALQTGDYYTKDCGIWGGKGARMLGLGPEVTRKQFTALASNKIPGTEESLTARTKEKRTPGYDFCFSVPKSVSVYLAETSDKNVEEMVYEAFRETMVDIESRMETRVRAKGHDTDRMTGNLLFCWFVHRETRPINGIPDPHFHIHAYVFNATFDNEEERWKAGQFINLKADAPFYEAAFNSRLASKLLAAGYGIRRTDRDFELASVSRELIEKFSKRTRIIEELAIKEQAKLGAKARALVKETGMEFGDAFALVKSELGAKTRAAKSETALSAEERIANWRSQMTQKERESLRTETVMAVRTENLLERETAASLAVGHLFERSSVARELHAAGMLLRRGIGRVSVDAALRFAADDLRFIRPFPESRFLTTRAVLEDEAEMLITVEEGRGKYEEIGRGTNWKPVSSAVATNQEQAAAVEHILRSRDLVTAIRGVAGAGKTTMLTEAVRAIASLSGVDVLAFAPSSSATEVLKKHGFDNAATVQRLLCDSDLQLLARGKVLLVDEAGFLSVREMRQLVRFALSNSCRVILSGDSRQHHSVERGDSLRILERSGVVASAALTKIFRQRNPALREAIHELAQGRTESGFEKLDSLGVIKEIEEPQKRLEVICSMHLDAIKENRSSLIVAPTHDECRQIANGIREAMKKENILGQEEHAWTRLKKLNLTTAQRQDAINYEAGTVVEFYRRAAGGFKSGEQWQVVGQHGRSKIVVEKNGQQRFLPLSQAGNFNVFRIESLSLSTGDKIRITKNFRTGPYRFKNNELSTVTAIDGEKITLDDNRVINPAVAGPLHLDQGIAVTSHAAQGKTVDQVLVSVPVAAFSQTNQAQFYVSMSRARASMHLFTDSKVALKEVVTRSSERLSPFEVISNGSDRDWKDVIAAMHRARRQGRNLVTPTETSREPAKQIGREIER